MRRLRTYRSSPPASQHIPYRRNSGSRPEPLLSPLRIKSIVHDASAKVTADCFALRITNRNYLPCKATRTAGQERQRSVIAYYAAIATNVPPYFSRGKL